MLGASLATLRAWQAGGAFHQLVGVKLAAVLVDVLAQPTVQGVELAGRDFALDAAMSFRRRFEELGAEDVAERVPLEHAADDAAVPVNILQHAVAVVWRAQAEVG